MNFVPDHEDIIKSALDRIDELMVTCHNLRREKRWVRLQAYLGMVQANINAASAMADALNARDRRAPPTDPISGPPKRR